MTTLNPEQWYVMDRGVISGPFNPSQLEAMRGKGALSAFSKVSSDRASWLSIDEHFRDRHARATAPVPVAPPPLSGTVRAAEHYATATTNDIQRPFPLNALLLLHYLTGGLHSFFWTTSTHGSLPRMKSDDPSGATAVGLCLVPLFNLYWLVLVYPRLAKRVNSLCGQYGIPPTVPMPLSYLLSAFLVIPGAMATAGAIVACLLFFSPTSKVEVVFLFFLLPNLFTLLVYLIVGPFYSAAVQQGINRVFEAQLVLLHRQAQRQELKTR